MSDEQQTPTGEGVPEEAAAASAGPWQRALGRVRSDRRVAGGLIAGAVAVVALLVFAVVLVTGGDEDGGARAVVAVTPSGDEAPRLGPVVISFAQPPATDRPERLVSIEPAVSGSYEIGRASCRERV